MDIDIYGVILEYLPITDIIALKQVDRYLYNIVGHFNSIQRRIDVKLRKDSIYNILNKHEIHLSGSYLMGLLTSIDYKTDIDLYVKRSDFEDIMNSLQNIGYTCDDLSGIPHYDFSKYVYNVIDFIKKDCKMIQIIVIEPMVNVDKFIYYNFDFDFLRSIYYKGELKISNIESISTKHCIYSDNQLKNVNRIEKYKERGFTFEQMKEDTRLDVFKYIRDSNTILNPYHPDFCKTIENYDIRKKRDKREIECIH